MVKKIFFITFILLALSRPAYSEVFHLESGETIKGTIRYEDSDYYTIEDEDGADQIVFKTDVARIETGMFSLFGKKESDDSEAARFGEAESGKILALIGSGDGFASENAKKVRITSSVAIWDQRNHQLEIGFFPEELSLGEISEIRETGGFLGVSRGLPHVVVGISFKPGSKELDPVSAIRYYIMLKNLGDSGPTTFNFQESNWTGSGHFSDFSGKLRGGGHVQGTLRGEQKFALNNNSYVWDLYFDAEVYGVSKRSEVSDISIQGKAAPSFPKGMESLEELQKKFAAMGFDKFGDGKFSSAALAGGAIVVVLLVFVLAFLFYLYYSIGFYKIAKKTDTSHGWMAFFPFLNVILVFRVAHVTLWSIPLLIIAMMFCSMQGQPLLGNLAATALGVFIMYRIVYLREKAIFVWVLLCLPNILQMVMLFVPASVVFLLIPALGLGLVAFFAFGYLAFSK